MVLVPEPAVKCGGAFGAGAVDGAVGPAVDQCADEAFGFAVGLVPVRPCADVFDAEAGTGERVGCCRVAADDVGEDPLDPYSVATVEGDGSAEEAARGRRFLVG